MYLPDEKQSKKFLLRFSQPKRVVDVPTVTVKLDLIGLFITVISEKRRWSIDGSY